MEIHKLNSFYTIGKFHAHDKLKSTLLAQINAQEGCIENSKYNQYVSRTDFNLSLDHVARPWVKTLTDDLVLFMSQMIDTVNYDEFFIKLIWFQQYNKQGTHNWHVHSENFAGVYYVDLPEDAPQTEYIDPITGEVHAFDVKEGDIMCCPAYLKHRSAPNMSDKKKTIIAWNMNIDIKGENHG